MSVGSFIDIGLGVIFVIALIVGAVRGMCRQFSRPLVGIFSIAGAIVLVMVLYPLFALSSPMKSFISAASGWFKKELYTTPVATAEELGAVMDGSYLGVLKGLSGKMFSKMEAMLVPAGLELTLGNFFGRIIVNIIVEFVMWLVLYLAIKYLLFGIKYLLKKITSVVVFKSIDKIFGIIWAIALTYIITISLIWTVAEIIIVKINSDNITAMFTGLIDDSAFFKFLHNTNVLGSFLAGLFGLKLLP